MGKSAKSAKPSKPPKPTKRSRGSNSAKQHSYMVQSNSSDQPKGKTKVNKKKESFQSSKVQSDEDDDPDDSYISFKNRGKYDGEDDDDKEVFDLNLRDDEDEDEEDASDDSEDETDSSNASTDEYDEEDDDLQKLVNSLPDKLRRKVLNKGGVDSDDEDEIPDEEEEDLNRWGKKKSYWNGDTADLEIGQDMEDAIEEEAATKELFQAKAKRFQKDDFDDNFENEDDESESASAEDEDEDNEETLGGQLSKSQKSKTSSAASHKANKKALKKHLKAMALDDEIGTAAIAKDISGLSSSEKIELIKTHSPELLGIIKELKERVEELQTRVNPVRDLVSKMVSQGVEVEDDLVDYLEIKQQLMLSYCTNVVFYLYMKSLGKSVRTHPVMKQLLKLRYAMEKMQSLDSKLKYQIDRLVKLADTAVTTEEFKSSLLRPNLSSMLNDEDSDGKGGDAQSDGEDEYDSSEAEREEKRRQKQTYKPSKVAATHYPNEADDAKRERKIEKHRQKLRSSELMSAIQDEFGAAPEKATSGGFADQSGELKKLEEEAAERIKFEEDHFIRTTLTRKEKSAIKRRTAEATRLDNFEDVGDFADLEELSKIAALRGDASGGFERSSMAKAVSSATSSKALERAFQALSGSKESVLSGKPKRDSQSMDDLESNSYKRRKAPEFDESIDMEENYGEEDDVDEDDDDDDDGKGNIFEDFAEKKKMFLSKKKEHYSAEPRYAGYEETVEDGGKRAASYEIIKNRGLTPHRKKANRNPRVKKREMFEKALVARKGQVQSVISGAAASYGGEKTGIKSQLSRSRKFS